MEDQGNISLQEESGPFKRKGGEDVAFGENEFDAEKAGQVDNRAVDPITPALEQEIKELRSTTALDEQLRRERRALTVTDLDTGDEYIIGENDPDFEWDTFEISPTSEKRRSKSDSPQRPPEPTTPQSARPTPSLQTSPAKAHRGWWNNLWSLWGILGPSTSKQATGHGNRTTTEGSTSYTASTVRTPFTKLSSFKFRKELGRGAFGRVLLAEAKSDGSLYALKIISKKNMRSSDKKQAKAERDILHAMGHTAPHPFTTGLKFAFQSGTSSLTRCHVETRGRNTAMTDFLAPPTLLISHAYAREQPLPRHELSPPRQPTPTH